jgi:hypothetical protein
MINVQGDSGGKVYTLDGTVSAIVMKQNSYEHGYISEWSQRHSFLNLQTFVWFLDVTLDEKRSLQKKGDTADELPARILDAAASIKRREDQLRRTTRDLRTRVAKCTEVDGGIYEHSLRPVVNMSLLCNKCHLSIKLKLNYINSA